jgi:hypothetical protein
MKKFLFISLLVLYGVQAIAQEKGYTHISPIMSVGFIRTDLVRPILEASIEDFDPDKLQIDLSYPTALVVEIQPDAFVTSIIWVYTATYDGKILPCPEDETNALAGVCELHQRNEILLPKETPSPLKKVPRELQT